MRLRNRELDEVKIKKLVRGYLKDYNCAQSVILSVTELLGIEVAFDLLKSARIFSGGIGYSSCLCGALGGALLMIGLLYPDSEEKAKKLFEIFKKEFGSSCCRALRNGIEFRDRRLKKHCSRITEETVYLLLNFMQEVENGINNNSNIK